MIDLHTHTFFSDGVLAPSELLQRAQVKGYTALAITDHCDASNLEHVVVNVKRACDQWNMQPDAIFAVPGVELTYVPPQFIGEIVKKARELGAKIIVVHGETIVEPVIPDTNLAAINAKVDLLAHPGLISESLAELAAKNGVALEITTRKGHSLTNGHVAKMAKKAGARLVINNDAHEPGDLVEEAFSLNVVLGCGLEKEDFNQMQANAKALIGK